MCELLPVLMVADDGGTFTLGIPRRLGVGQWLPWQQPDGDQSRAEYVDCVRLCLCEQLKVG